MPNTKVRLPCAALPVRIRVRSISPGVVLNIGNGDGAGKHHMLCQQDAERRCGKGNIGGLADCGVVIDQQPEAGDHQLRIWRVIFEPHLARPLQPGFAGAGRPVGGHLQEICGKGWSNRSDRFRSAKPPAGRTGSMPYRPVPRQKANLNRSLPVPQRLLRKSALARPGSPHSNCRVERQSRDPG